VVGTTPTDTGAAFAVAQFTPSGELDTRFNGTGMGTLRLGPDGDDRAQAVTFLGPDHLVVGGYSGVFGFRQFALAAYETTPEHTACPGDCDGDGTVRVNDLITMVNVALGNAAVSACTAGDLNQDNMIVVAEIVAAVNTALNGCPAA